MDFLHNINDASMLVEDANHMFVSSAERQGFLPLVVGTQTATTASWTGDAPTIDALYDGLTIAYWLPRTSASNVTLNLKLKNGSTTGAINCYYSGTSRLTTHYAAGNIIIMTYIVNHSINGTNYTGWWAHGQYNTTYSVITEADIAAGTSTSSRVITAQRLAYLRNNMITVGTTQPTIGWWFEEI